MFPAALITSWNELSMLLNDHFEVLVTEGGSRSSASNCERWRRVIVSLLNSALLGCWSQCSPRGMHGWTRCPRSMMQFHRFPCSIVSMHDANVFRQLHKLPCSIWRFKFFVQTFYHRSLVNGTFYLYQQTHVLYPQVSPIDHRLIWGGLERVIRGTSPKDCWTNFPTGCCSTVGPDSSFPLIQSCFNEIFGGGRGDKFSSFVHHLSSLQSHNFWSAISWKCSLKNDGIRSCLIEN